MYIDPREHRRRTWRVIGRTVLSELKYIAVIIGFGLVVAAGAKAWAVSPLLVIIPAAAVLLVWLGTAMWSYAEDKARKELAVDKARKELAVEHHIAEKRERRKSQ